MYSMKRFQSSEKLIGLVVKSSRARLNLTQAQLSTKCGLSQQAVSDIELGKRSLLTSEAFTMARALNIDINSFDISNPASQHSQPGHLRQ